MESSRTLTFVELVIVFKMMLKVAAVSYENVEMEKFRGKSHCGDNLSFVSKSVRGVFCT